MKINSPEWLKCIKLLDTTQAIAGDTCTAKVKVFKVEKCSKYTNVDVGQMLVFGKG